jgi:hypothetical protein
LQERQSCARGVVIIIVGIIVVIIIVVIIVIDGCLTERLLRCRCLVSCGRGVAPARWNTVPPSRIKCRKATLLLWLAKAVVDEVVLLAHPNHEIRP